MTPTVLAVSFSLDSKRKRSIFKYCIESQTSSAVVSVDDPSYPEYLPNDHWVSGFGPCSVGCYELVMMNLPDGLGFVRSPFRLARSLPIVVN